jgi:hypothetical protein
MLRVWNGSPPKQRVDPHLTRRSALARPIDLLSVHKDEAYAFTHALMYLTDLGTRRVRLPRALATIEAEADVICAASLDEPDYDLCGESLLTSPYLRRRWSATATFAFAVLASVEEEIGFLPAPGVSLERLKTLRGTKRLHYVLTSSYHSAFVMGLLCAAALRDGCAPPHGLRGRRRYPGATAELLPLLGANDSDPPWRQRFEALPPGEQDAAAPLLLNVCLRRAALRRDLAVLRAALLVGERHRLLDAPAPRQAAELLRRSAMFASLPQHAM